MRALNLFLSLPPPKPPHVISMETNKERFEQNMQEHPEIVEEAKQFEDE